MKHGLQQVSFRKLGATPSGLTTTMSAVADEASAAVALVGADGVDTISRVHVAVVSTRRTLVNVWQRKHTTSHLFTSVNINTLRHT